jgi:hypothetical protein
LHWHADDCPQRWGEKPAYQYYAAKLQNKTAADTPETFHILFIMCQKEATTQKNIKRKYNFWKNLLYLLTKSN